MLKGVYLCSREHRIPGYDIDYNDVVYRYQVDICCSCECINLGAYDYIIATPPCNFWSRANWRRYTSDVARLTKHLLPYCLSACLRIGKPFLIENVRSDNLFKEFDDLSLQCYVYKFGNHTFWTNIELDLSDLIPIRQNKQYLSRKQRDNNYNVHIVIIRFLETITRLF